MSLNGNGGEPLPRRFDWHELQNALMSSFTIPAIPVLSECCVTRTEEEAGRGSLYFQHRALTDMKTPAVTRALWRRRRDQDVRPRCRLPDGWLRTGTRCGARSRR